MTQPIKKSSSPNDSMVTTLFLVLLGYCLLEALDSLVHPHEPAYGNSKEGSGYSPTGANHCEGSRKSMTREVELATGQRGVVEIAINDYPVTAYSQLPAHLGNQYDRNNDTSLYCKPPRLVSMESGEVSSRDASRRNRRRRSLFNTIGFASAIRLVRLEAPETIHAGQPIRLRCLYETKGDRLQSLSWYKNGREFYRYQPFERRQPILAFNLTGFTIETKLKNSTVTLVNTTVEATGRYKCQVTGTSFQEVNMEVNINVVTAASGSISVLYLNSDKLCLGLLSLVLIYLKTRIVFQ